MKPVSVITGVGVAILVDNIDTDTIIPSREMRSTGRTGLAEGLFAPWRYRDVDARTPDPDFALNRPEADGARVLVGGRNFGCGSSREHAVWALAEYGIEAVIAPSFAPIFRNNCIRNGLLPVELAEDAVCALAWRCVTIDLPQQRVSADGQGWPFAIDAEAKAMLLEGLDAIDLTLRHRDAITAFHELDRKQRPWIYLPPQVPLGEGDHEAQPHGGGVRRRLEKSPGAVNRARQLRRDMSPPERRLWAALRQRPGGLKFRKQHPADVYVLDFYCAAANLCIEIDGQAHDYGDRPTSDERRDAYLAGKGIATLRVAAGDVGRDLDAVVRHIIATALPRVPLHHSALRNGPPPQAGLGEETG